MPRNAIGEWTLTITATGTLPQSVLDLNEGKLDISQQHIGSSKGDSFNILVGGVSAKGSSTSQAVSAAIDGNNEVGFVFLTPDNQAFSFAHGKLNSDLKEMKGGKIYSSDNDGNTDPTEEGSWSATSGGPGEGDKPKY